MLIKSLNVLASMAKEALSISPEPWTSEYVKVLPASGSTVVKLPIGMFVGLFSVTLEDERLISEGG